MNLFSGHNVPRECCNESTTKLIEYAKDFFPLDGEPAHSHARALPHHHGLPPCQVAQGTILEAVADAELPAVPQAALEVNALCLGLRQSPHGVAFSGRWSKSGTMVVLYGGQRSPSELMITFRGVLSPGKLVCAGLEAQ